MSTTGPMKPTKPKALAGIDEIKQELSAGNPQFAAALGEEADAEKFCRSVRDDLKSKRQQKKIDQTELGRRLDMSQSAVSKVEIGSGDLGLKTLYRFADELGFRPIVLLVPSHREASRFKGRQVGDIAQIELTEKELLRQLSDSVSQAMQTLVKK